MHTMHTCTHTPAAGKHALILKGISAAGAGDAEVDAVLFITALSQTTGTRHSTRPAFQFRMCLPPSGTAAHTGLRGDH